MNETQWKNESATLEVLLAGRFEWQGRVWELGATPANPRGCLLVFREEARPDEFFFLARRSMSGSQEVFPEAMVVHEPPSLPVWRESLKLSLEHGAWGRLLWFDSKITQREGEWKAKWQLFLLPDGRGVWKHLGQGYIPRHPLSPFQSEGEEPDWANSSALDWSQWVWHALERDTDLRYAIQFARLSNDRKFERAIRWRSGTPAELERVCRWIGQLVINRGSEWDGKRLNVWFLLSEDEPTLKVRSDARTSSRIPMDTRRAEELWMWAWRVFGPCINGELAKERLSVAAWLEFRAPDVSVWFHLLDSQSERSEVLGQLLYWARNAGVEEELLLRLRENAVGDFPARSRD